MLHCCYLECKGLVLGPGMSAVPSNVGCCYSITSSLCCCHLEFKVFVLGPGMSAVSSNVGCFKVSLVLCCDATLSVKESCRVLV